MKICIYGAGAVGGLVAARLARADHEVSVVARGAHLTEILAKGLRVRSGEGDFTARIRANVDPSKLGEQDTVFVAVKGQSLPQVAADIAPLLGEHTSIVTAMNGVPWWFFDRLPFGEGKLRLETLDPGGALSRAMPTGRTAKLAEALAGAGFEAVQSPFIEKDFWVKLLGNVSFNPVSALTLATADRLLADAHVKAYMVAIMREVLAIGRAAGVDADIDPEARMDMARHLGVFKTSMLQDLEAGKALEIDGLLSGTLEIASKAGVAAPFTESLLGLARLRAQSTGQYP